MNLKDKVVVITGGSKGLGKAMAQIFVNEGSKVVINSINNEELQNIAKEIGALGVCADVTKEEELTHLMNEVKEKFGQIDIWINNAGLWMPKTLVENLDMDSVKKMFDVNIIGTINGTRVALREMKKNESGCIVNIISNIALMDQSKISSSVYGTSKWAVNGFTKFIRGENENISILAVYPGAMKTDLFSKSRPDNFNDFMEVEYVAEKIVDNLKNELPEQELVIQK